MSANFTDQAANMFNAAQQGRIPENLQHVAEEAVTKTREAYDKISLASKDNAKVVSDAVLAAQAGSKTLGELLVHNTSVNTAAAFDAAQAIVRAKSIPEAGRLQADFMQKAIRNRRGPDQGTVRALHKDRSADVRFIQCAAAKSFERRAAEENQLIDSIKAERAASAIALRSPRNTRSYFIGSSVPRL